MRIEQVPYEVLISELYERAGRRDRQAPGFGNPNWGNRERLLRTHTRAQGPIPVLQFPQQAGAEYFEPRIHTVAIAAQLDLATWTGDHKDAAIIAQVTAGAGASYQSFEVDVTPNTQFNIVCNTLTLKCFWLDDTTDHPDASLIATIGSHAASNSNKTGPTCTRRLDAVEGSATSFVLVPPFATSFAILSPEAAAYNAANLFRVIRGPAVTDDVAVSYTGSEALDSRSNGGVALPSSAVILQLVNNSGGALGPIDVRFNLAL